MERLLFLIVLVLFCIGIAAGAVAILQGNDWSPRNYVAKDGECFVPPQGDPLYDEKYSQINQNNCEAFVNQSEAFNIDAQTDTINISNATSKVGLAGFGLVIIILVILGLIAVVRGASG